MKKLVKFLTKWPSLFSTIGGISFCFFLHGKLDRPDYIWAVILLSIFVLSIIIFNVSSNNLDRYLIEVYKDAEEYRVLLSDYRKENAVLKESLTKENHNLINTTLN